MHVPLLLVNTAVVGVGVASVAAYGLTKWWDDGFTGSFHSVDEGWFGQDTRYGGADKAGHAYAGYVGVRLVSALLQSYGNDAERAARIAFWATLGTLTAVEVADGFSKQQAFNYQDAVMNAVGAGFAWWLERNPDLDELLDLRLYYRKSNESESWDALGDYSGNLPARREGVWRAAVTRRPHRPLPGVRRRIRHAGLRRPARDRSVTKCLRGPAAQLVRDPERHGLPRWPLAAGAPRVQGGARFLAGALYRGRRALRAFDVRLYAVQ